MPAEAKSQRASLTWWWLKKWEGRTSNGASKAIRTPAGRVAAGVSCTPPSASVTSRTADLLGVVLDRLYVLRNQLVHGGATWNGKLNRNQLHDGCMILGALVPAIVSVMMHSTEFDDDPVAYPALPDISLPAEGTRR